MTVADSSLDLTKALTLEAWVRPTQVTGSWRTVVMKERSGQLSYSRYAGNGSVVRQGREPVFARLPLRFPVWNFQVLSSG